jgi:hypothetical protein
MRRRLLASVMREYISPHSLAEDLLEWLSKGKDEEIRTFLIVLLHGVGWLKEPPKTADAAATKPIKRPEGEVLIVG